METRNTKADTSIRRRRECLGCGHKFTTYEKLDSANLIRVVKSSGSKELFDKDKLIRGISSAFERRNINANVIEKLANSIEKNIISSGHREISSKEIGELVLDGLLNIDEVAYIRFASVYKRFQNVDSFIELLNDLKSRQVAK